MINSPFRLPRITPFGVGESFAEWVTGLNRLDTHYQNRPLGLNSFEFMRYTLQRLNVTYDIHQGELEFIPKTGPVVIVANHPLGALEGVILAEMVGRVRPDVKVLANEYLKQIPEISELFIGVDVFETKQAKKTNTNALREAHQHLADEGILIIFPAGEVSTYNKETKLLSDKRWSYSAAKFIEKHNATTVPIYIDGKNSQTFYLAGKIHPLLRTLMLGREMLNKKENTIHLSIGTAIPHKELSGFRSPIETINYLRLNTYLLATNTDTETPVEALAQTLPPVIAPINITILEHEIASLPNDAKLLEQNGLSVYCSKSLAIPNIMQEIGRIREVTFREVGEGTGLACDLDEYDTHYYHLFIWHQDNKEIVGSYRLGLVDELISEFGLDGLYSRSLFNYQQPFIDTLNDSIEVGRSVIAKKYQRNVSSLLLLWKGISTFVYQRPKYTHLFGPVSISNDYSLSARQLIASTLAIHHYDNEKAALVSATTPLKPALKKVWNGDMLSLLGDLKLLSKVLNRIEKGKGLPVLLRQYIGLNGKLVCFNVDPDFNDALDGLIVVDMSNVPHKTLSKYMGKEEAMCYLEKHHCN
ncbi:lysophospholipid acyltransferase family protein [Aliivibrio sifiae]|uniref:L-ornithine N(alpha)-acyltransferase n=1 Tax=Aliivibrio sifiae TaxID=566293 RepID=A0A2S7X149_9GAMM|nr:lysophospholipid acyltransferase family protein [Aliivibrio sifiae]PQJ83478.1 hemolysin [Aliivibrio sifiae]